MKVQFLKNHLGNKEGELTDVDEDRARYWIAVGVAQEANNSVSLTATEAASVIKNISGLRELNSFVKGDERKTVLDAYEKRHAELKGE
jgi:hypothetical protein